MEARENDVLEQVDQLRREDPTLERQLERYRADREAYERVRGVDRGGVKPAVAPAPARGGLTSGRRVPPRGTVGGIR